MKTEKQIREELKIRESFKNSESYGSYRANHTIINTLKWVLDIPSTIKTHSKEDKE